MAEKTDSDKNLVSGLDEIETVQSEDGLDEFDRDKLLIDLDLRFTNLLKGRFRAFCVYILPLSLAFTISGSLLILAFLQIDGFKPVWMLITGNAFLILGILSIVSLALLYGVDKYRLSILKRINNREICNFNCKYLSVSEETNFSPHCAYFNRELENHPLCIICPIYERADDESG